MRLLPIALALWVCGPTDSAVAQSTLDWPVERRLPYHVDSGPRESLVVRAEPASVFEEVVRVEGAAWLRVYFGQVQLAAGSFIRITAAADNEVQELDASVLAMWQNASAYFNGDTVVVELMAAAGTAGNRLVIKDVAIPNGDLPAGGEGECGICVPDDRVASSELWSSRLLPAGCTASVYDDSSCMVSAGHCIGGSMVVQFDVPNSNANCSLNNPPVEDQFPIVTTEFVNGGIGNDWSVLIPGTNNLGQLPFERYGELRPITLVSATVGQTVAIWGYGVDQTCTLSQTQRTSSGSIFTVGSGHYRFDVDVRGGNSGSALIRNDEIIGIVTHCSFACPSANSATRVDLQTFAASRNDLCGGSLTFTFPNGLPDLVDPDAGAVIDVEVGSGTADPVSGTGTLHLSINGGFFNPLAMTESLPNVYQATIPTVNCPSRLAFYFSATTTVADLARSPQSAPDVFHSSVAATSVVTMFEDNFEADLGWTVSNSGGLTAGAWERGVPVDCNRGDPPADADGSGQCFVTFNSAANGCDSDVDDGTTTLLSPILDASDPFARVSYFRWYSNSFGSNPLEDTFVIDISDDGGANWVNLETVGPAGQGVDGGWIFKEFFVADIAGISNTSQLRLRFSASDLGSPSVVEAGVDGIKIRQVLCPQDICPWDVSGDGSVSVPDLLLLLAVWGLDPSGPPDFDGDGIVAVPDLLVLLANWGPCPF